MPFGVDERSAFTILMTLSFVGINLIPFPLEYAVNGVLLDILTLRTISLYSDKIRSGLVLFVVHILFVAFSVHVLHLGPYTPYPKCDVLLMNLFTLLFFWRPWHAHRLRTLVGVMLAANSTEKDGEVLNDSTTIWGDHKDLIEIHCDVDNGVRANCILIEVYYDMLKKYFDPSVLPRSRDKVDFKKILRLVQSFVDANKKDAVRFTYSCQSSEQAFYGEEKTILRTLLGLAEHSVANTAEGVIHIAVIFLYQVCYILFSDTGTLITPSDKASFFDLFKKLNVEDDSSGMSLAMVKIEIENMGGKIAIKNGNVSNKGVTFEIKLPSHSL